MRPILSGRFEPIEVLLALSAVLHGIWLVIPYWAIRGDVVITPAPRIFELVIGTSLFLLGSAHLASIKMRLKRLRKHMTFLKFITWLFLTFLAYLAVGPDSIIWIAYLTVSLVSAIVYLNVNSGDNEW